MKRILSWSARILAGLLVVVVLAVAGLYAWSEVILRRSYRASPRGFEVPTDSMTIREGERLATIRGCNGGCHGRRVEGGMFVDEPLLARVVAPNLTAAVRRYSNAELDGIIRHGVRPNGRSVLAMPSEMFSPMSDRDLGAIVAFIRAAPETVGRGQEIRLGPMGRLGVALGWFKPAAQLIDPAAVGGAAPPPADTVRFGSYLARTSCTECHGVRLEGNPQSNTPDLRIASGYGPEQFRTPMRTGTAIDGRKLGLMREVAEGRFRHFTDAEIAALHAYLIDRAQRAAAPPDAR